MEGLRNGRETGKGKKSRKGRGGMERLRKEKKTMEGKNGGQGKKI